MHKNIKLRLPWKFRIPGRVRRYVTSILYDWFSLAMVTLSMKGWECSYGETSTHEEQTTWYTTRFFHIVFYLEQPDDVFTAILDLEIRIGRLLVAIQLEDYQEVSKELGDGMEQPWYGDHATIRWINPDEDWLYRR